MKQSFLKLIPTTSQANNENPYNENLINEKMIEACLNGLQLTRKNNKIPDAEMEKILVVHGESFDNNRGDELHTLEVQTDTFNEEKTTLKELLEEKKIKKDSINYEAEEDAVDEIKKVPWSLKHGLEVIMLSVFSLIGFCALVFNAKTILEAGSVVISNSSTISSLSVAFIIVIASVCIKYLEKLANFQGRELTIYRRIISLGFFVPALMLVIVSYGLMYARAETGNLTMVASLTENIDKPFLSPWLISFIQITSFFTLDITGNFILFFIVMGHLSLHGSPIRRHKRRIIILSLKAKYDALKEEILNLETKLMEGLKLNSMLKQARQKHREARRAFLLKVEGFVKEEVSRRGLSETIYENKLNLRMV